MESKDLIMKEETEKRKEQKKDSWLNVNIMPIMAILIIGCAFFFFNYVLQYDFTKESLQKDILIYMIGTISTLVSIVVSYYFGSSQGSGNKSKFIEKISDGKN